MADSGDAAMAGIVIGGAAGYKASDGNWVAAALGAGAGFAVAAPSGEAILD